MIIETKNIEVEIGEQKFVHILNETCAINDFYHSACYRALKAAGVNITVTKLEIMR